jgi:DNA ligase D-like protein (predicted ligase)
MAEPMLCAGQGVGLVAKGWIYELKLDGVRIVCDKRGDDVQLWYRSGRSATASYPEIARGVAGLQLKDAVLDGEIVAFGATGQPSFQRLEQRIGLGRARDVAAAEISVPVVFIAFDLLAVGEEDLRDLPLVERRRRLQEILPNDGRVRGLDWAQDDGTALFDACRRERLEGVIAKRADSKYASGRRTDDWVKIKCQLEEDFVVVGFTRGTGGRGELGALDVASYEGDALVVRGKAGSGIGDKQMRELVRRLSALAVDAPPAKGELVPAPRGRTHVRPEVVVSVRFASWSDDGHLRHPVFRGIRDDVRPADCRATPPVAAVHEELAEYYAAVGATMLPYLAGRSAIDGAAALAKAAPPLRVQTHGWLVLDCDAKGAVAARDLFAELGLPAFAKTGEATDYQVVVAVGDAPKGGVAALAEIAARLSGGGGGGVVRVAGSPILAPYSPVGVAGSRVSAPVAWDEVVPALDPRRLTTRTVPARLARAGDPMAPLLAARVDFLAAVGRLEARLARASESKE